MSKRKKAKPQSDEQKICAVLYELLPADGNPCSFAALMERYQERTGVQLAAMLHSTQQPTLSHLLASKPDMFIMGPSGVMRSARMPAVKKLKGVMSGDDIAAELAQHMVEDEFILISSLCNKFRAASGHNASDLLNDLGLSVNQFMSARRDFVLSDDRSRVKRVSEQARNPAYFQVFGADAQPSISLRTLGSLTTTDTLRELLLWLMGDQDVFAPSQFFVAHQPLIQQICCLVVSGMNTSLYDAHGDGAMETIFNPTARGFLVSPGTNNSAYAISTSLLSKSSKKKSSKGESVSAESLLLSESQLAADEYPPYVPGDPEGSQFPDFIETTAYSGSIEMPMYALDCEMCRTQFGLELARLTLVDSNEAVKMDVLVKTTHPIVDYNTRYSGITEEMMNTATMTLVEAREAVMKFLHAQCIVVGHSVGNDLKVLRLVHRRVLDSACLYPHKSGGGYKNSLKWLTKRFLNQQIQEGSHDSAEDAIAALRLAKLKMRYGPQFGSSAKVSIWTVCKWNKPGALCIGADNAKSLAQVINSGVGAADIKMSKSGDEGVARDVVCSNAAGGTLVFGHLSEVYAAARANAGLSEAVASAIVNVRTVYDGLQKRTLFLVCGDRAVMDELLQLQQKQGVQPEELQQLVKRIRKAYFWVTVKE